MRGNASLAGRRGTAHLTQQPTFARLEIAAGSAQTAESVSSAEVAELADARGSGPRTRKGVGVRVPSSAPYKYLLHNQRFIDKAVHFPDAKWPTRLQDKPRSSLPVDTKNSRTGVPAAALLYFVAENLVAGPLASGTGPLRFPSTLRAPSAAARHATALWQNRRRP